MGSSRRRSSFVDVVDRATRLADALKAIGVQRGGRVGTFMWNHQERIEAYCAVSAMGAVIHTHNIRLSEGQLIYIVDHADDHTIVVHDSFFGMMLPLLPKMLRVSHVIVNGTVPGAAIEGAEFHAYEGLLAAHSSVFALPEIAGPWVTGSYYSERRYGAVRRRLVANRRHFVDHSAGYLWVSDRANGVIKSGGEWISAVDLENALAGHPNVFEAAAMSIPHPRSEERLMAVVGATEVRTDEPSMRLGKRVGQRWIPNRWSVVDESRALRPGRSIKCRGAQSTQQRSCRRRTDAEADQPPFECSTDSFPRIN